MLRKASTEETPKASAQEIQFAPGLLAELCDQVLASDNVFRVVDGPGFVLFGRAQGRRLFVEAFRECESNPMFESRFPEALTKEEQLISLIVSPRQDLSLKGMEAVGWSWWSPEGDLKLEALEATFLDRFFKEFRQIALKLKSVDESRIEAGLFLRDPAGVSFSAQPDAVLPLQRGEGLARETGESMALLPTEELSHNDGSLEFASESALDLTSAVAEQEPAATPLKIGGISSSLLRSIAVCGFGMVAGLFLAMWKEHKILPGKSVDDSALTTKLTASSGNLVLSWNSKLGKVNSAQVQILDGDVVLHFDLTKGFEQHGMFEFPHDTGNVQAILTIVTPRGSVIRHTGYSDPAETLAHLRMMQAAQHEREVRKQAEEQANRMDATNRRLAAMIAYLKVKGSHGQK